MIGGLISLRYLSAWTTCMIILLASRSGYRLMLFQVEVEVVSITVFENSAERVGVDLEHVVEPYHLADGLTVYVYCTPGARALYNWLFYRPSSPYLIDVFYRRRNA